MLREWVWRSGIFYLRNSSLRVYPHQQNTGGFFICVLEKGADDGNNRSDEEINVGAAPENKEEALKSPTVEPEAKKPKIEKEASAEKKLEKVRNKNFLWKEEPYVFLPLDSDIVASILYVYSNTDSDSLNLKRPLSGIIRYTTGQFSCPRLFPSLSSYLLYFERRQNNF